MWSGHRFDAAFHGCGFFTWFAIAFAALLGLCCGPPTTVRDRLLVGFMAMGSVAISLRFFHAAVTNRIPKWMAKWFEDPWVG